MCLERTCGVCMHSQLGVIMNILLLCFPAGRLSEAHIIEIQAAVPNMRVVVTLDRGAIEAMLDDIEIAVGNFPHDLLPRARNLRWLQDWGAGVDWLLER